MARPVYGTARAGQVYEARDEDYWEEQAMLQQQQQQQAMLQAQEQQEYDPEYYVDDDEYDPADEFYYEQDQDYAEQDETTSTVPVPQLQPDVVDQVYFDPASLTNTWLAALHDYKFEHPSQFAPAREAPRSMAQKQAIAPLWYGSAPALLNPTPRSAAEAAHSGTRVNGTSTTSSTTIGAGVGTGPASAQTTGSSKSAKRRRQREKQAAELAKRATKRPKLEASTTTTTTSIAEPGDTAAGPASPRWQPESPDMSHLQQQPLAGDDESEPPALVSGHEEEPSSRLATTNGRVRALARQIPQPPPIVPLDEEEQVANGAGAAGNDMDMETDEELLGAALWAWYNAGYQQGLLEGRLGFGRGRS